MDLILKEILSFPQLRERFSCEELFEGSFSFKELKKKENLALRFSKFLQLTNFKSVFKKIFGCKQL